MSWGEKITAKNCQQFIVMMGLLVGVLLNIPRIKQRSPGDLCSIWVERMYSTWPFWRCHVQHCWIVPIGLQSNRFLKAIAIFHHYLRHYSLFCTSIRGLVCSVHRCLLGLGGNTPRITERDPRAIREKITELLTRPQGALHHVNTRLSSGLTVWREQC